MDSEAPLNPTPPMSVFSFLRADADSLRELHHNWALYLAMGAVLISLGAAAIIWAFAATLITAKAIGWLLIVAGIVMVAHASWTRSRSGFFLHLLLAVLYVIVGALLAAHPGATALSLTLLLAAFLMGEGAFRIVGASIVRFPSWGWVVFDGIVTFVVGLLIALAWPATAFWVLGFYVGIHLIFTGWSFVMLGTAGHHLPETGGRVAMA